MKNLLFTILSTLMFHTAIAQTTKTTTSTIRESSTATNADDNYALTASFGQERLEAITSLVSRAMGKPDKKVDGIEVWTLKSAYTIILQAKTITINLNKEKTPAATIRTIETLGREIQKTLSSTKR